MALQDMDLFLERHLKGRAIYIPKPLNVSLKTEDGELYAEAECDEGGILQEAGICYAEAGETTKSVFRDWHCVLRVDGKNVTNGKISCRLPRYQGAATGFVYAFAKYINGFKVSSKIVSKKFADYSRDAVKSRVLYSGDDVEGLSVANYEDYSAGGVFMEQDAVPKLLDGYGGIKGAYSVGGIMTYKISSPRFVPEENALLEFDVYVLRDAQLKVGVDIVGEGNRTQRYSCTVQVKGGGKWKRIILSANELKSDITGAPLTSFTLGQSLLFDCEDEDTEYAVTNILWL
jgi:hypothetical protein